MMRIVSRATFTLLPLVALACGESSGSVLERVPDNDRGSDSTDGPPETHLRMDVFFILDVESCAVGEPCDRNDDPDSRDGECFRFEDEFGTEISFRGDTVEFFTPDDPRVTTDAFCFHLGMDDEDVRSLTDNLDDLRNRIYSLSDEEIVLDWFPHQITTMTTAYADYENEWGIFLEASALAGYASGLSRETDFVMAISGRRDLATGVAPVLEHCAGTIRDLEFGLGGAPYTWLTTECDRQDTLLRHWMFQIGVALRGANRFNDSYDRDYPPCGEAEQEPDDWWPSPDECSVDPDAPTCGENRCEGTDDDYVGHVLTDHWERGRDFVGNHCRNGRRDLDETDVDFGGACALLTGQ
jgi:hypothetical protein